jgi:hypothetical protein
LSADGARDMTGTASETQGEDPHGDELPAAAARHETIVEWTLVDSFAQNLCNDPFGDVVHELGLSIEG